MASSFTYRVATAPGVVFRAIGDACVLLNVKTGTYLGADAVGTRMWVLLTSSESIQAAYDRLFEEFDVEAADLRRDVEEFIQKLLEHGLILPFADNVPGPGQAGVAR